MLTGSQIRRKFLDYFIQNGHKEVHSSSLVPANDPTLLFTNAGMNQFKDVFLGLEKREYSRATTSQKCVRAGGKHNDLENVGFTARHHTFFEMLGNFSFGDYFKREAVAFAWELITSPQWFGIRRDRLYVTIFKGEEGIPRDGEAYEAWIALGVPPQRIFELGMKDNFWAMGETGPCGPCSEIHYDMGPEASTLNHKDCWFPCECGRYVEIWNLVFMQFDRSASQRIDLATGETTYSNFKLNPLPKPSIDTGMGLERITAALQGKISNYDTDLFVPLIQRASELRSQDSRIAPERDPLSWERLSASLRVIADHSRATTFLVNDGVVPSNEGRGYVLRKIMRRGIRHARLIGISSPILPTMVQEVVKLMSEAYPDLLQNVSKIIEVAASEESNFDRTVAMGSKKLDEEIITTWVKFLEPYILDFLRRKPYPLPEKAELYPQTLSLLRYLDFLPGSGDRYLGGEIESYFARDNNWEEYKDFLRRLRNLPDRPILDGRVAFRLYDTFGLPLDFIIDAARDQRIGFDQPGFDRAMQEQREKARASWKGVSRQSVGSVFLNMEHTKFVGYTQTRLNGCKILYVLQNGRTVQGIRAGETADVILDATPFYAESGGQVGDVGWLLGQDHSTMLAEVTGCYFPIQGVRAHKVIAKGVLIPGNYVDAVVNADVRQSTMRNHTGTHLIHAALRQVLGTHVKQAGSLVDPGHLRFDFSHFTGVADEELQDIEDLANREVLKNERIQVIEDVPIDVAVNEYKAMALFGEKYGDKVRVIRIGDFSTELCGGTHTAATGEIGLIKVLREGSVSSGVRRVEAVTGEGSLKHFRKDHELENVVATVIPRGDAGVSPADALKAELERREEEIKKLRRELEQVRLKSANAAASSAQDHVKEVKGVKVLATRADNLERPQMRTLVDNLRNKLGSGVVVVGSAIDGKVAIIVGVTKDLTDRVQAGKVVGQVAQKVGGSGGGRPDMAEAGGKDPGALDAALASAADVVESLLK